jgi:hypothetical protein
MAKIVETASCSWRCVLNFSNYLQNYTASHAKDSTARFSPRQQQLAARPYPELAQSCLNSHTPFSSRSVSILSIRFPPPSNLKLFLPTKFSYSTFAWICHLSICATCLSSSFAVSKLMWQTCTVLSESRCALRLRYVDLVVSIEVTVEVCCCFTVFSC